MSQNRGFRRDGRQSYQVNSSNYGRSMNVNPWEGGLVPGGPRSSVAGLLPTPPQASNLISQLSSPEAQLALASNLLTTLFRPQQQQQQVPSLLSLGALGQMGGVGTGGYRQQSNYGHTQNRYQDRRKMRADSRRTEPYNKMGNRNRDSQAMQDRRSTPSKGGPERKPGSQGYRSPNIGKARPTKGGAKPDKKDDKEEEENEDSDKTNEKKADEEDSKREDGDDDEEKKRDWKDEKKGEDGEGDEEGKKDKDDKDEKDSSEKRGGRNTTSRYGGIPNGLFFCHVCKKHMWDDHSFENHLKGRSHQLMMEKLEESYKIKVDLMRHELQVAEQQREIEMERVKRQGKKVQMSTREYCTMCDLYFFGNIVMHRKTERHQQLKSFLHPRCLPCGKEFPTRVEWDHHKLTALHLRKTAEARKTRKGSDDEFGIEDFISSDNGEKGDIKVRTKEEEENDIIGSDKEKGDKDDENKDSEENKEEGKEYFKAEVDSSGNLRYRIPKYNSHNAVGQSLLKKVVGQICRTCHRFFLHEEDAKTHCRTLSHFQNYIELLKTKAQVLNQERRGAMASSKKKEEKEKDGETTEDDGSKKKDESEEKGKRGIDDVKDDDEGNWKRRKVANANEEDEEVTEEASAKAKAENGEEKTENKNDEEGEKDDSKIPPGQEKYDPLEAENEYENDEKEKPSTEENSESKEKGEDIVDDDNLWAEVDRDIGTLLDTVDGEAEAGSPAGEEDASKTEKGDDAKPATRTRGNVTPRGAAASPRGVRGRKKK